MTSTNLHARIKTKFLQKHFLPIFQKKPLLTIEFLKTTTCTPKSPTKTSSRKCFKCLGFGHIATSKQTNHDGKIGK